MQSFRVRSLSLILAALAHPVLAQQSAPTSPGGTVTGHVLCSDTQLPARFAQVMLFGVPTEITAMPKPDSSDTAQVAAAMKALTGSMNLVQTQTDIDGSFAATNVAPGDYY